MAEGNACQRLSPAHYEALTGRREKCQAPWILPVLVLRNVSSLFFYGNVTALLSSLHKPSNKHSFPVCLECAFSSFFLFCFPHLTDPETGTSELLNRLCAMEPDQQVCMICTCLCACVCVCVHEHVNVCVCVCVCMHVHIYIYMYVCVQVCMYVCIVLLPHWWIFWVLSWKKRLYQLDEQCHAIMQLWSNC